MRRLANHFHASHEPGILDVEAREPVGLGLHKSIFINFDIANCEGSFGPLPTNHDAEVARAVRLTEDDTREGLHRFLHGPGRLESVSDGWVAESDTPSGRRCTRSLTMLTSANS